MKKNIPLYDIILFGILLVLAVYYFVVQGPIKQKTEELAIQKEQMENEIIRLQPSINQKRTWEEALEKIYKKYNNNPVSIPDYDNIDNIINEMHLFLDDCGFSIVHGDVTYSDNIYTRNLTVRFNTRTYETAKAKIEAINNSTFKYQITDLSLTANSNDTYTVSMKIVAYEYGKK